MPDPLPQHPDFGFFNDPGDEADELDLEYTYPQQPERLTRVTDAAECERLTEELAAAREQKERFILNLSNLLGMIYQDVSTHDILGTLGDVLDELSALTAQLTAARLAYAAAYQALVTDNPWRMAEVRAALGEIGAALGVEL